MRGFVYILLFIFVQTAFGFDRDGNRLTFEGVLGSAMSNAVDPKIATLDRGIAAQTLKETKSLYYPTLSLGANGEYVRTLTRGATSVSVVGDTMLGSSTQYQSSVAVTLGYSLYDFGLTGSRVSASRMELAEKDAAYILKKRELKITILRLYTDAYIAHRQAKFYEQLKLLQLELLSSLKRLHEAGRASKMQIADEAISLVEHEARLSSLNSDTLKALNELTLYTKTIYSTDGLSIKSPMEADGFALSELPDFEQTPEYETMRARLVKKEAELSVVNLGLLPKISFYSKYNLYGSSPDKYQGAYGENMTPRSFTVGIGISMPIFEGFKHNAQSERAKLELDKSRLEMEQARRGFDKNKQKMLLDVKMFGAQAGSMDMEEIVINDKTEMTKRLRENSVLGLMDTIRQMQEIIKRQASIMEIKTRFESAKMQTYFMAEKTSGRWTK